MEIEMKKYFIALFLAFTFALLTAQSLSELSFGTDETLEIISWNIEWFPKDGQTTIDSVSQIIRSLDADVYALQEIDDTTAFRNMINETDEYNCYFKSGYYGGLTYVYKTSTIEILDLYEIYTEQPYWRPFPRSPQVMEMNFDGQYFVIINNHFKAFGDDVMNLDDPWDEETRRYDASNLLKQYIENHFEENNVIVLGDLNDVLTDDESYNVFQNILDDPENFLFADIEIAQGSSADWSYPNWPSHIDHILITNELFDEFENSTIQTIKIDNYMSGGMNDYDEMVSDHRPVGLKLVLGETDNEENVVANKISLTNYPNPFNPTTTFSFSIDKPENVNLTIYNAKGQLIKTLINSKHAKGKHNVSWYGKDQKGNNVTSGVYFTKLQIGSKTVTGKCLLMK
jgi:endonuclease/exonuclease/phosphatase family metal-dependent hydrolase